uniref:Evasin n=1 Tax=Amblyomma triste TaxID=251400 RepID=A0A023G9Q0_AMBTT
MLALWILVFGCVFEPLVALEKSLPPAEGCGEVLTTKAPSPVASAKYGNYTDPYGCVHNILISYSGSYTATCVKICRKRRRPYKLFTQCLQLPDNPLQERQDLISNQSTLCQVGRCIGFYCVLGRTSQKCYVPKNYSATPSNNKAE